MMKVIYIVHVVIVGCISLKFGLGPNDSTDEHQRVGRVVERREI